MSQFEFLDPLESQRGMKLILNEHLYRIPRHVATSADPEDAIVHVKLFSLFSNERWFIIDVDPRSHFAYGLVQSKGAKPVHFNLDQLAAAHLTLAEGTEEQSRIPVIERDLHWTPRNVRQVIREYRL